jgi:hypothetical protein
MSCVVVIGETYDNRGKRKVSDMEGIQVKKVDSYERVLPPPRWRKREPSDTKKVIVHAEQGYVKILLKKKMKLARFFDSVELGLGAIGDWGVFETAYEKRAA